MNLEFLLDTVKDWYEFLSARFLALYEKYFLYLMYIEDSLFTTFSIDLAWMCAVHEKSANFFSQDSKKCLHFENQTNTK